MLLSETFRNAILRRIRFGVAQVTYHLVTLYDKTRTLYTIFRTDSNDNFEASHLFAYPPIRLNVLRVSRVPVATRQLVQAQLYRM
jgi:hypothetical protein